MFLCLFNFLFSVVEADYVCSSLVNNSALADLESLSNMNIGVEIVHEFRKGIA
jgi:hypothetical protein